MSGGHLVVTDRAGRDSKRYSLPSGLVTVGSDSTCDIRMMLPAVSAHHATVVVRANQAVIRNVSDGETFVNGEPISVAALHHGDIITLGDRSFRWEYSHPSAVKPAPPQPALFVPGGSARRAGRAGRAGKARGAGRAAGRAAGRCSGGELRAAPDPAVQLMLEMRHRNSMPGSAKQVAVVQPQRRNTNDNIDIAETSPRPTTPGAPPAEGTPAPGPSSSRRRAAPATPRQDLAEDNKRKSTPRATPNKMEQTKASLWIESRKSSPRVTPKKSPGTPKLDTPKTVTPKTVTPKKLLPKRSSTTPKRLVAAKATPLRTLVLRKAFTPNVRSLQEHTPRRTQSATKVAKIQAPLKIDHTKQAALLLMARHSHKGPSLLVKKTSPLIPTITPKGRKSSIKTNNTPQNRKSSGRKSTPQTKISLGRGSVASLVDLDTPQTSKSLRTSFGDNLTPNNQSFGQRCTVSLLEIDTPQGNITLGRKSRASLVDLDTPQTNVSSGRRSTASFVDAHTSLKSVGRRSMVSLIDIDTPHNDISRGRKSRNSVANVSQSIISKGKISTISLSDMDTPLNVSRGKSVGRRSTLSLVDLDTPQTRRTTFADVNTSQTNRSERRSTAFFVDVDTPQPSTSARQSRASNASNNKSINRRSTSLGDLETSQMIKTVGRRSVSASLLGRNSQGSSKRVSESPKRASSRISAGHSVSSSILELSASGPSRSRLGTIQSPIASNQPSPKKSSMKNPLAKTARKIESIKFDLSNLDDSDESTDVFIVTNSTKKSYRSESDEDLTLQYSDATQGPPSPRRPGNSRSSKILQKTLGSSISQTFESSTLTPHSPKARKSSRGSFIVQKALSTPEKSTYSTRTTKSVSDTPRQKRKLESYSIVDLVNDSKSSEYGSISSASTAFGTPQNTSRKTKSTINPMLVDSSTPFAKRRSRSTNSKGSDSFVFEKNSPAAKRSKSTPESGSERLSGSRRSGSDVLVVSNASPKNSANSPAQKSRKSLTLNISNASSRSNQSQRRSSRKNDTDNTPDGMHTPENQVSPQVVGTPVLNLQSLIDSSILSAKSIKRSRISANLKRKTIGARALTSKAKSEKARSKSLNLTAAKRILRKLSKDSSNTSDRTDEGASKPCNDETITPKSTVMLVQEAVKEKHSTAKKPVSKRSIIDNLNDSDIVKQLFASPVKRKLSQSMTEYTRSQLEERPKRTRNTIALTGRSPDQSFQDNSRVYTPDVFVSPLNTQASPVVSGNKRSSRRNTQDNRTSNVGPRTPPTRKSVKNDLTNVAGIKNVFAKSPRNRLSDLKGVKEVFTTATSPQNDLRRVSGVKKLFLSEKKRKQPINDLRNVSGVKRLFRPIRSPKNDLRNVSGVKKTLAKSPKNDLRDVRGVNRIFARNKTQNGLSDVSGVEELFNESYDSHRNEVSTTESLFDQLVGKPTIKLTYAKSFNKSSRKTPTKRSAKSLSSSIKQITTNVEAWLEKELQHKSRKSDSRKSQTLGISRELQNLQTDTVEGTDPVQTTRARNSSLTVPSKTKSASEIYSAHTLPIKKRSIAEKSPEKRSIGENTLERSENSVLPIKKRALLHQHSSTPVKGRINLTANASELGRISPIVADRTRGVEDTVIIDVVNITASPKAKPTPKRKTATPNKKPLSNKKPPTPKPKRNTRVSKAIGPKEIKVEAPKRSTKTKTISPKTSLVASPKPRPTRGKKEAEMPNTKRCRGSLVITKKSPTMSPILAKTTRGRRTKDVVVKEVTSKKGKKATPKKNAIKVAASPKRAGRKVTAKVETPKKKTVAEKIRKVTQKESLKKAASPKRRKVAEKVATPKKTATPRKSRKDVKVSTPKKSVEKATPKKNTRKVTTKAVTPKASPKKATPKKTRKVTNKVATPITSPIKPRRGRKAQEKPSTPNVKVKKATIAIAKPSPLMKPEPKTRRGQKVTENESQEIQPKRGRKAVTKAVSTETAKLPTPAAKTKKGNLTVVPSKGRKRKITEVEVPVTAPKKGKTEATKTRGKKTVTEVVETETRRGRQKKSTVEVKEMEITKKKRGESVVETTTKATKVIERVTERASPKKRGGKAQKTTVAAPAARGRKRKSEEPASPKKVAAKKSKAAAKAVNSPSPVKARSTRQKKPVAQEAAPAARSRRR